MEVREGLLDDPRVQALIALHRERAHAETPANFAFALDLDGLKQPYLRFFSAWDGETLLGIAALRRHDGFGEVKSMRTAPDQLRRGVAQILMERIMTEARDMGLTHLRLETGTSPAFTPAVALYHRLSFTPCMPFADYRASPHNQFMELAL